MNQENLEKSLDKSYKRWSDSDKIRLKRIYNACGPSKKSGDFWIKLTEMFGEGRSVSSIQEQCLRMKLQAKKPPRSPICTNDGCAVSLIDGKVKRVGNYCQTCYNKKWQEKSK